MAIRVVLGEDSFLVREGVATVLGNLDDVELVDTAGDLDELRASVERAKPDVVVTDIRMPPSNTDEGIQFAEELRSSHPDVGVVILSQHAEPRYAISLLSGGSGRRAYLLKERLTDEAELNLAVEKLVNARQKRDSELGKLTPREFEILGLIAQGRSNGWIASKLTITKRAVERHINAIFLKLDLGAPEDVNRRVQAALLYLSGEHG
jgi:DNA-binding NarL/FixJ family response regulator